MVITSRQIWGVTVTDWPCGMLVLLLHIIMYLCMLLYFWVFQLDLMAEGDIGWGTLDLYRPALAINHDSHCKGPCKRSFNLEYKTLSGLRINSQADPSHDFIFHNQASNFVRVQTVSTYKLLHTSSIAVGTGSRHKLATNSREYWGVSHIVSQGIHHHSWNLWWCWILSELETTIWPGQREERRALEALRQCIACSLSLSHLASRCKTLATPTEQLTQW